MQLRRWYAAAAIVVLSFAIGTGVGWNSRKPVAEVKSESKAAAKKDVTIVAAAAASRTVTEAAPREVIVRRRYPVMLPGPGCPVAMAEETRTEKTADQRITAEASRQAATIVAQESSEHAESLQARIPVVATEPRWSFGLFAGSSVSGIARRDPEWWGGGSVTLRLVGHLGASIVPVYVAGEARIAFGLTYAH